MKTVCPHCLQKYDVPDDYLQQDVTCEKCEKDFTVTKAKFCSGCGTPNATQGFTCWKCHEKFPITINSSLATSSPESPIENPGNSHLGKGTYFVCRFLVPNRPLDTECFMGRPHHTSHRNMAHLPSLLERSIGTHLNGRYSFCVGHEPVVSVHSD